MTNSKKKWFASWFDTPYYHTLYKDRNDDEARAFMEALTSYLNISENCKILDLACGKGRHSIHLNKLGYTVTGADLSEQSIAHAKTFENDKLNFVVHDMSKPLNKKFNFIFNLFTSFGYFDNEADNLNTINAIKASLQPNGIGVIDFINIDYIKDNLIPKSTKEVDGITFDLSRKIENGYLIKTINFKANNDFHEYQERVKALTIDDFKVFFQKAGLTLIDVFGDYKLNTFNRKTSKRLILIFM